MSQIIEGTCHCGAVKWRAPWDGTSYLCNCSLCRRKQQITAVCTLEEFELVQGAEDLSLYQWNKGIAKHWFCKTCGVYTHHQRRSDPNTMGLNLACVDDVDLDALTILPINGKAFD